MVIEKVEKDNVDSSRYIHIYIHMYMYICIYTSIDKAEMFHVVHNKVALLKRRRSERGTRNRHQRIFRKVEP